MTEPVYPVGKCGSCQAPVIWAITAADQKQMPVDAVPTSLGTVELMHRSGMAPLATVLGPSRRFGRTNLRTSHFATCPNAEQHRKPRKSTRRGWSA